MYSDSIEGYVYDHREDRRPVDLYDHGIDDLDDDQVVGFVLPFEQQVTMQRSCKDGLMMKRSSTIQSDNLSSKFLYLLWLLIAGNNSGN